MKQILRNRLKQQRDGLDKLLRSQLSTKITSSIHALPEYIWAKKVAIYYPINSEVDILGLICSQKLFAIPNVVDETLIFHQWDGNISTLEKGAYSPISKDKQTIEPQLAIIPMLGFDRSGNRLGYGRGCYDRYLQQHNNITKIGVAFSCQECQNLPYQAHDQKMDFIITEKEIIKIGK